MPTLTPEMIETVLKLVGDLIGQYQLARAAAAARLWYREKAEPAFKAMAEAEYQSMSEEWADLASNQGPLPHGGGV